MCHEYIMETILNPLEKTIAQKKEKLIMTVNDILETEQLKYCYEQAYRDPSHVCPEDRYGFYPPIRR